MPDFRIMDGIAKAMPWYISHRYERFGVKERCDAEWPSSYPAYLYFWEY